MPQPVTSLELDRIREDFVFLDHWEDRYRYIIDLGDTLPEMDSAHKTAANLVHGCQSLAWIVAVEKNGRLDLAIDSDARIVRGLIALVRSAVNGERLDDVLGYDFEALFTELDLLAHLSPSRGNGLRALVERIRHESQCLLDLSL